MVGELVRLKREVIRVHYGPPGNPEHDFWYEMVMKVVVVCDGVETLMQLINRISILN